MIQIDLSKLPQATVTITLAVDPTANGQRNQSISVLMRTLEQLLVVRKELPAQVELIDTIEQLTTNMVALLDKRVAAVDAVTAAMAEVRTGLESLEKADATEKKLRQQADEQKAAIDADLERKLAAKVEVIQKG